MMLFRKHHKLNLKQKETYLSAEKLGVLLFRFWGENVSEGGG